MSNKPENLDYVEFKKRLDELGHLGSALVLLNWDLEVHMPRKAAEGRAATFAYMAAMSHQKFVDLDKDGLLARLKKAAENGELNEDQKVNVNEIAKLHDREKKLPQSFVMELSELTSRAHHIWAEARQKSDFKSFAPTLRKIFELKRKEADLVGYKGSPYNALLDVFEPEMTVEEITPVLEALKKYLIDFLRELKKSKVKIDPKIILGDFPKEKQRNFNRSVVQRIGFDFDAGLFEEISTHPFQTTVGKNDVRYSVRYDSKDLTSSLNVTLHENGHALYEQGFLPEHFGTPLAQHISLGIHESQSRLWENIVGRSREFWKFFYPKLQREFPKPFKKIPLDKFLGVMNRVKPSLIRVEADEVSYNLHVIIRFEIERDLLAGKISVDDLPKIWNQKYKDYLGVTVPDDARGVLQDVHWSAGLIGYFPTYSLGNLYSAQMFFAAKKELPKLEQEIARGNFKPLLNWLRKNIHVHGRRYTAAELIKRISGEELSPKYFEQYLERKYKSIYKIE